MFSSKNIDFFFIVLYLKSTFHLSGVSICSLHEVGNNFMLLQGFEPEKDFLDDKYLICISEDQYI